MDVYSMVVQKIIGRVMDRYKEVKKHGAKGFLQPPKEFKHLSPIKERKRNGRLVRFRRKRSRSYR